MENNPNPEEFYDYFKWIDDAVVSMLRQQLPAGAEVINGSEVQTLLKATSLKEAISSTRCQLTQSALLLLLSELSSLVTTQV